MSALDRLALDGGTPRLADSNVAAWPQFTSNDDLEVLRAANRAMTADHGRRPTRSSPRRGYVASLERRWSSTTGRADVVACTSGAVAVGLVATGLELAPDDEVIMAVGDPSAVPMSALGVHVVSVDVDPETLQIDPAAVEAAITPSTRAVLAADRFGTTADYRALERICELHDLALVEDGSQSIGAALDRRPVGALATTSICVLPNEVSGLMLGPGALYTTDDLGQAENAQRAMLIDQPIGYELAAPPQSFGADTGWGSLNAEGSALSQSYASGLSVMSEVDAAIAVNRLTAMEDTVPVCSANGTYLRRALDSVAGIWIPSLVRGATHTYRSFPMMVVPDELGLPETAASALRATLVDCMTAEGLWIDSTRVLGNAAPDDRFPVSAWAHDGGLVLGRSRSPFSAADGIEEMDRITDCFAKILVDNLDRVRQLTMDRVAAAPR